MRDESFARERVDEADQAVFRARLNGRRPAVTALAILIVMATATIAAGASRYLPTPATGAEGASVSPSAAVSLAVSLAPSLGFKPAPSVELAPPITTAPTSSIQPSPMPNDMVAWTDATPTPIEPSPSVTHPLDPWRAQVTVTDMELPAYAVAGKSMTYSILLTNGGDEPVSLEPCPGYKQSIFGMPDNEVEGGIMYLLNCPAIGPVIAPGQGIRLQMIYRVPEATQAGQQLFFWVCDAEVFHAAIKAMIEIRAA